MGHIGCARVPFMMAFLRYLQDDTSDNMSQLSIESGTNYSGGLGMAAEQQGRPSQSSNPSHTPRRSFSYGKAGPRPCVIWKPAGSCRREPVIEVLLMGTYSKTPLHRLPDVLLEYFMAVYTPMTAASGAPDWDTLPHIHASPYWAAPATQWLIPLIVPVSLKELEPFRNSGMEKHLFADGRCSYINEESLSTLARIKDLTWDRFSAMISQGASEREAVEEFLSKTKQVSGLRTGYLP